MQNRTESTQVSSEKNTISSSSPLASTPPSFNSAQTAKPVAAIKAVTTEPTFWQKSGRGTRTTPLTKGGYAKIFVTDEEMKKVYERTDVDKIIASAIRERWINKVYQKCIKEDGCKQVIILGSGYDIRPFKKNQANQLGKKNASLYASVKFWEIDRAPILDEKERIFNEKNLDIPVANQF